MLVLVSVFLLIAGGFQIYYSFEVKREDEALLYWVSNVGSLSNEDIEDFYRDLENNNKIDDQNTYDNTVAIKYDMNKKLIKFESVDALDEDRKAYFQKIGETILLENKLLDQKIKYRLVEKEYGYYLVMIDTSTNHFTFYTRYVALGGLILMAFFILFLISLQLSRFVTKPAEETLNKQKQFISDASHELKTPLSAIILNAEALQSSNQGNQNLANILSEATRMEKLITNLLELARADDVSNKLVLEDFNLSDALMQIALPFESVAYEAKIKFETQIEEDVHYIGNSDDIKQVIAILIDNAFKHTHEGGTIKIILEHTSSTCLITIFNTGDGISQEDLPHIFERFYSCDQSRNGIRKSYGLGLAIAKAIIEKHQGQISVDSEYGKNAQFHVILPQIKKH